MIDLFLIQKTIYQQNKRIKLFIHNEKVYLKQNKSSALDIIKSHFIIDNCLIKVILSILIDLVHGFEIYQRLVIEYYQ